MTYKHTTYYGDKLGQSPVAKPVTSKQAPVLSQRWDHMSENERIDIMRQLFAPLAGVQRGQL